MRKSTMTSNASPLFAKDESKQPATTKLLQKYTVNQEEQRTVYVAKRKVEICAGTIKQNMPHSPQIGVML